MNMAMETFHQLDEMSRNALEPVLQGIVLTASASTVDYKDLKMVLAEKYEYKSQTDSIVSSTWFSIVISECDKRECKLIS